MTIHPVIVELLEKTQEQNFKPTIEIKMVEGKIVYIIDGFYKSNDIELKENDKGELVATSRYQQTDTIESCRDLVALNHEWWQSSQGRGPWDGAPDEKWLPLLVSEGFVKVRQETKVISHYD